MIEATLTYDEGSVEADHLSKIFSYEDREFDNERARYETERVDNKLLLHVQTKDSTALRAVMNTISKIMSAYEYSSEVLEDERRRDTGEDQ